MADDENLRVELVAPDRLVWSGEASFVLARTADGEIGIMRNHAPVLSVLDPGAVVIQDAGGDTKVAAVDGGFLSVADNRVSILSEHAETADEIDLESARRDVEQAGDGNAGADQGDDDAARRLAWAQARVDAAQKAGRQSASS
ncbi:MAG: F0F1 ATP synthase subunit epsilon [Actinomycetota bacterium]|nr:F0F1 ATP synthase subunit epsilon [Actinomycetota bacterium]